MTFIYALQYRLFKRGPSYENYQEVSLKDIQVLAFGRQYWCKFGWNEEANKVYVQVEYLSRGWCKPTEVPKTMWWRSRRRSRKWKEEFIRHYQRNGWMDLSELWDIDSSNNKGMNTVVTSKLGWKWWFFVCGFTNETHNGWYLRMVSPIPTIVGTLIVHSKNMQVCNN